MKKEKVLLHAVVVFAINENGEILLGWKPVGRDPNERKIGEGCWNGPGGGVENGETELEAAIRETVDESGISLFKKHTKLRAIVYCHNEKSDGKIFVCKLYVFVATRFKGVPQDSEEMMDWSWFRKEEIPYHDMMADDIDWLPHVLNGTKFYAQTFLKNGQKTKAAPTRIKVVKRLSRNSDPHL